MDQSIFERMEQAKRAREQTLAQYRASQLEEITLNGSKLTVFVRNVTLSDLMMAGRLPQTLLSALVEDVDGGDEAKTESVDLYKFASSSQFGELLDAVVLACVVEPPISDAPCPDSLGIGEISNDDKMQIFAWANREVAPQVKKFRRKSRKSAVVA